MEAQVYSVGSNWAFKIVMKNGVSIAVSMRFYASRRNAVAAAKLIAGSRIKVVVE